MAELQQPNIVGNFLAAYSSGLERQQQQQDAAYQRQRQAKADQMTEQKYNFDMEQGQIDRAINMLKAEEDFFSTVPDNVTAETLQPYVQRYSQAFGIPVEQLAHITPDKIPGIKERSGALLKRLQVQKAQADIAQSYAAAAASNRQGQGGGGEGGTGIVGVDNKTIDNESTFRKEYFGNQKDFMAIRDAYGRVSVAAQNPSAAGDLALIFNYMKMLDPGSVVREQEFANAQNAAGVPERVRAAYNNALRGERLTDATRADFTDRAGRLFTRAQSTAEQTRQMFGNIAQQYGFSPDRVAPDLSFGAGASAQPESPPQFSGSGLFGAPGSAYAPNLNSRASAAQSPATGKTKRGVSYTVLGD